MPNKLFDYASVGLPIIATLSGEAKILINNKSLGFSNDEATPDWIAKKIIESLENDYLWLNVSKSIELISCKYDREMLAKEFINFMDL